MMLSSGKIFIELFYASTISSLKNQAIKHLY